MDNLKVIGCIGVVLCHAQVTLSINHDNPVFLSDALWTAPEHIFNENFPRSQQGDLFSYGIVLSEILTRGLPYSMFEDLSAKSKCCECSYFAKASEPPPKP